MASSGQGTIEYLVILGVIILIGLVVIGISTNFLEQTEQINSTNSKINSSIGLAGISITENILDSSGNGALTIKNTSGNQITLTKIMIDGVDNNYSRIILVGDKATLLLNNLSCTCSAGETSKTCTYTFYFIQNGVATTKTKTLTANCSGNFSGGGGITPPIVTTPTCTSFSYSSWDDCNIDGYQTRTVQSSLPSGCTGGTPDTTQACTSTIAYFTSCYNAGADPIPLCNCDDIDLVQNNLSANYVLQQDINYSVSQCTEYAATNGYTPIGEGNGTPVPYTGTFDGNDHKIYSLSIDIPDTYYVGMFGYTSGATIQDLNLIDITVLATNTDYVGTLAAEIISSSTVSNCHVSGTVSGSNVVGGIIGKVNSSTVANSTSSTSVTATANSVGGIAGDVSSGNITDSSNSGAVTGINYVGGIVGMGSWSTVTNCNNSATITGTSYVEGIVGYNNSTTITNCTNTGDII
jgi:hypothetical protein